MASDLAMLLGFTGLDDEAILVHIGPVTMGAQPRGLDQLCIWVTHDVRDEPQMRSNSLKSPPYLGEHGA